MLALAILIGVSGVVPASGPERVLAGQGNLSQQEVVTPISDVPTEPPATEDPPTEIPPTEIPPTEVPPTEVPPTDVPTIPPSETPIPTETATIVPTSTATPSVTPTATPSPAVAWSLGDSPSCTSDDGAVESGGSVVYTCTLAATIDATAAPELALDLAWSITTDASSEDWTIAVRGAGEETWVDAGDGTPLSITDAFVTGNAAAATDTGQTLERTLTFQLRLARAACVTDDPPVNILIAADLTAPGSPAVPISARGATTRAAVVTPVLAAIPEPSIAFLGPLAFGEVSLPSTDQVAVLGGSTTLQVDGLDRSCGMWTIAIESGSLATADGRDLDAANLLLVSVSGQLAPGSPCGLDEPCLIAMIVAGPTSVPSIQLALGFQVIVPADAPLGVLNAPVTATISQETASP